jgi:hypothetical protein
MSNISIENPSYDSNMDSQAMDALTGGGVFGCISKGIKRACRRINPCSVYKCVRCVVRRRMRRWILPSTHS